MSRWTSDLVPTSMPRVGSSMISSFGCGREPLRQHDLLLVAARERPDGVVEAVVLELQARGPLARQRTFSGGADDPARRQLVHPRHRRVARDREVHHEPLLTAVLGHEADPGAHRGGRLVARQLSAVDLDVAGVGSVDPEDRAGDLRAAGADEAREGDDLAGLDVEGDVEEDALAREPLDSRGRSCR